MDGRCEWVKQVTSSGGRIDGSKREQKEKKSAGRLVKTQMIGNKRR